MTQIVHDLHMLALGLQTVKKGCVILGQLFREK